MVAKTGVDERIRDRAGQAADDRRAGAPGGKVPGELPRGLQSMGITSGVGELFSIHPPTEERIAALQHAPA
jgi:Zn-dependent protease with chaperone function